MRKNVIIMLVLLMGLALPVLAATSIDCMSCHGSTGAKYPLAGAKLGFEVSGHATMGDSRYANGQSCQRCHTSEGYVEYATKFGFGSPQKYDAWANATDKNGNQPYIAYPSQPGCFACHDPHTTGNFALRTQKVVSGKIVNEKIALYNGVVYDGGSGNLCASCHMSRGDLKTAIPAQKGKVAARGASHHGPEADMVAGTNGYEFVGKTYSSSPHYQVIGDTCVTCHMEQPKGRFGFSPEVSGHAFTVSGEVHEAPVGNTASCAACHDGIKAVAGQKLYLADSGTVRAEFKDEAVFTVKAKADYDGNGKVEYVQQEVVGLLQLMVNKDGTGAMQKMANPFFKPDGSFANSKASYTNDQLGAYANYLFVIEDKSLGVHNATYAIELLMDSIAAIDPSYSEANRP